MALLWACAGPRLELASAPSQPSVSMVEARIGLTILPNAWHGSPSDLAQYYTPVQILIENNRPDDIHQRVLSFQQDLRNRGLYARILLFQRFQR